MASNHVDDGAGHEKRRDPPGTALGEFIVGVFNQRQTANTRANHAADTHSFMLAQRVARFQATVQHGLAGSCQAIVNKAVHMAGFFFRNVIPNREAFDFAGNFAGKAGRIKFCDQVDA